MISGNARFPAQVTIVEVGARDGLQNLSSSVSPDIRAELIDRLATAGLKKIEAGSFVSPRAVPQMADSDKVLQKIHRHTNVQYSALTPNLKGLEEAIKAGADEVAIFASASESFSQKNINCSISESLKRFESVMAEAAKQQLPVRGYVSCIMGCPYDGEISPVAVATISDELYQMGCYEISLGDTIGVGTALKAKRVLEHASKKVPITALAAHFHNTCGQALVNLYAALEEGLAVVDSSVAGLGGCPYAPGASGNVATEDVVYMMNGMGIDTGVNMDLLLQTAEFICNHLGISTQSSVGRAQKPACAKKLTASEA